MPSPRIQPLEPDWQDAYRQAGVTLSDLLIRLELRPEQFPFEIDLDSPFEMMIPPHYFTLIRPGNPADPLLLQVLARRDERTKSPGSSPDPLREAAQFRQHGVIQKYRGRALLLLSGACAIHCRYCFRRHYDYGPVTFGASDLEELSAMLAGDPSIHEVLLSGGDPLSVSDRKIATILRTLDAASSIRSIRLHTRTLTAVPSRVTPALLEAISTSSKNIVIVVHTNHPNEIDEVVRISLARLRAAGATLLNQSVLLAGVNDDSTVLAELSWRLLGAGVLPYYLHLLDPVAGADHFTVSDESARVLQHVLRATMPGYLVPKFVREIPGGDSKIPLDLLLSEPENDLKHERP